MNDPKIQKLILRAVALSADKIPDKFWEALPGGYYKSKEAKEVGREAELELERTKRAELRRDRRNRRAREYSKYNDDDNDDGYSLSGEEDSYQANRRGYQSDDDNDLERRRRRQRSREGRQQRHRSLGRGAAGPSWDRDSRDSKSGSESEREASAGQGRAAAGTRGMSNDRYATRPYNPADYAPSASRAEFHADSNPYARYVRA